MGNPLGDLLGGLFKDLAAVSAWIANLAGEFCEAYDKGGMVGGGNKSASKRFYKRLRIS
jgi:hypothetical protein